MEVEKSSLLVLLKEHQRSKSSTSLPLQQKRQTKEPAITDSVVCSADYGQSNIEGRHDFVVDYEHSFPKLDKYSENDGPYWMNKEEKVKTKADVVDGTMKEKDKSKDDFFIGAVTIPCS